MSDLDEFRAFLGSDPARPAADAATLSDQEFGAFIDGEPLDVEARARQLKTEADAREAKEFLEFARAEMLSKGYSPETGWVRPEVPAEDPTAPMPEAEWVVGADGQPVQVASFAGERWQQFVDYESDIGSLDADQFDALLAARDQGKSLVFDPEAPSHDEANEIGRKYGLG